MPVFKKNIDKWGQRSKPTEAFIKKNKNYRAQMMDQFPCV